MPILRQYSVRESCAAAAFAWADRVTWAHSRGMLGVRDHTCRSRTSSTPGTCSSGWCHGRGRAAVGGRRTKQVGKWQPAAATGMKTPRMLYNVFPLLVDDSAMLLSLPLPTAMPLNPPLLITESPTAAKVPHACSPACLAAAGGQFMDADAEAGQAGRAPACAHPPPS